MEHDRYGLPLTTASERAAAAYREGVDGVLAGWPGAGEALDRAIEADPAFALAYIARARIHQVYAEATEARAKAGRARDLAAQASRREQRHIEVLALAGAGRVREAIAGAEEHLEEFPRDALVLAALLGAYGLYAFSGRPDHDAARVAICEGHARHYGQDWWFLTYRGWSHTEAGDVAYGRSLTEQALALRWQNAHGAHALAHALFEQGDTPTAGAFLADWLPAYDRRGILNGHLSWHQALLAIENGDADGALGIYDDRIRPAISHAAPAHLFADATSLLWRLALNEKPGLGPYWQDVAEFGNRAYPRAGMHFVDLHHALVSSATSDNVSGERRIGELTALDAAGKLAPGSLLIDLYRGIQAFAAGGYEDAARILEPLMSDVVRVGGSHAQRELCEDTLIVAYLRAGQAEKARVLIDSRLHRRPSRRDEAWRRQAEPVV